MNILLYQVNRATSALHSGVLSDRFELSRYENETNAKKAAFAHARTLRKNGYHVTITAMNRLHKWSFVPFK